MLIDGDVSWKNVLCASIQDTDGASAFSCSDSLSARKIPDQEHEFKVPCCITMLAPPSEE